MMLLNFDSWDECLSWKPANEERTAVIIYTINVIDNYYTAFIISLNTSTGDLINRHN